MAPRAQWKGFLKFGEVVCPVALYTAASTSDRIAFHTVNRDTGNRVRREFVDSVTGEPVGRDDQVKGYEVGTDDYIVLEPEEVAAAIPESDKTLAVEAFVPLAEVDDLYFDKPYYLAPADRMADEAYALIRDALGKRQSAAIAQAVLFRRMRTVLIRPQGDGMIATTLNFDYEIRPAKDAFSDIAPLKIKGEMLDLAKHIIGTKKGTFDPTGFHDRYEEAVAELVKAKIEGRTIARRKEPKREKVTDLMEALRQSAALGSKQDQPAKGGSKTAAKSVGKTGAAAAARKAPAARRKAG
ncbi:Ku protein [Rhizobium sp. TRM96647]|uniref:non-homologous end joining protein Ku n=1 Tax=unclassified Rhizobium TaxID=2613769 RepID=UPI0021E81D07|nr:MULTISPECIES: Ku protein [unclassified Rhizobium]MCV3736897.1 Ku protein [Rhizobium sp. TRM96647]MCV3756703.1 Ku protein [Rhizobium sp. TRM96650]